ncbi:hypothetical protein EV426DRAFT_208660 [Tirmania nivea]|nr:hypothetical protein EV426DRAFT_208660 [Tirmania nivea]
MWRLNMRPSIWQRPCWRLRNEITRSHLWTKHTASRITIAAVPHVTRRRLPSGTPLPRSELELANRPQLWQQKSWRLPLLAKQTNTHAMPVGMFTSCSYYQFRKPNSRDNITPLSSLQSASSWSAPQHSVGVAGPRGITKLHYKRHLPLGPHRSRCRAARAEKTSGRGANRRYHLGHHTNGICQHTWDSN